MMDELFEKHLGVKSFEMGAGEEEDSSSGESEDDYWSIFRDKSKKDYERKIVQVRQKLSSTN